MDHLTTAQREQLQQRLEREREVLLRRVQQVVVDESSVELDTGDRQDAAASEAARALELRLARHEQARLRELEAALQRMADGTYGYCEETGEEIPFPRLELQPTARYTVEALELREREAAARARVRRADEDDPY